MLQAMIFDMDGVLVDSQPYINQSFNRIFAEDGYQLTDAQMNQQSGRSLKDQLEVWQEKYGIRKYDLQDFSQNQSQSSLNDFQQHLTHQQSPQVHWEYLDQRRPS